jgi:hypothetical protein
MKRFAISMASPDPEMPALELRRILLDAHLMAARPLSEELLFFMLGLVASPGQYQYSV